MTTVAPVMILQVLFAGRDASDRVTLSTKPLELAPGDMLRAATRHKSQERAEETAAALRERWVADDARLHELLGYPPGGYAAAAAAGNGNGSDEVGAGIGRVTLRC